MTTADLAAGRPHRRGLIVRRGGILAIMGLFVVSAPGAGRAQEPPDTGDILEGVHWLLLPTGAQGVGLGRAMTALQSEEAAFWNPAGLADQSERRAMVYSGDQVGPAVAVNLLFPWARVGTLGVSYYLLDIGTQEVTGPGGTVLGSLTVRNHVAIASFGTSLPGRIDAGINAKLVRHRKGCSGVCEEHQTTSSAYALDVGVQAEPFAGIPLRFGGMLAHAGTEFRTQHAEQSELLPSRLRLAVAYEVLHRFVDHGTMDLWFAVEAEDRLRDPGSPSVHMGMDFSAADVVHVRAGYVHVRAGYAEERLDETDGATVGLGFRFERFDLNMAKYLTRSTVSGDGQPIHFSLGVSF